MTDQEINIAIAEACGFIRERMGDCANRFLWSRKDWLEGELVCASLLPDYLHDLNAMHEAEKVLTPDQERTYVERLSELLMKEAYDDATSVRWARSHLSSTDSTYRATVRQRCEAFLRVKGLWKD